MKRLFVRFWTILMIVSITIAAQFALGWGLTLNNPMNKYSYHGYLIRSDIHSMIVDWDATDEEKKFLIDAFHSKTTPRDWLGNHKNPITLNQMRVIKDFHLRG